MIGDFISIIVPVYNVEKYLVNCIQSILNQTYSKFQIILINDGSSDRSGDICDYYARVDSRIKVIHQNNTGVSDARNKGLDVSSCNYTAFIDADDYIHPEMIHILFNNLKKYNTDISMCCYKPVNDLNYKFHNVIKHDQVLSNQEILKKMYGKLYIPIVVAWNKIYKRSLFDGIRYPVGKIHEDEFITYKLLYKAKKIVYTDAPLYYYLQRPDSIMSKKFNLNHLDALEAQKECYQFLYQNHEAELFNKAFNRYLSLFLSIYFKIQKNKLGNLDLISSLKEQYIENFEAYISDTDFSVIRKFKYQSFIKNEHLCQLINSGINLLKGVER
jgi:glycosyltransferase involved in cell wall biosynthesis